MENKYVNCPDYIIALLRDIERLLDIVMWNINQEEYESPFRNTGNVFKCEVFEVRAYDWENDEQEYNFKCGDIKICWYKYLGRGCVISDNYNTESILEMYNKCIKKIREIGEKHENEN